MILCWRSRVKKILKNSKEEKPFILNSLESLSKEFSLVGNPSIVALVSLLMK